MDAVHQLLEACADGNVSVVKTLLDTELGVDASDDDDNTPLQVAAANGQEQIVRLLLERGAALDKPNSIGWTPLLHAVRHGHSTVAAILLLNGANVNATTSFGANAATLAARSGNLNTCKLLENSGVDFYYSVGCRQSTPGSSVWELTPLIIAAHRGHDTVVRHLLNANSNLVNYQMPSLGTTALLAAAIGGHVSTAKLLVERGHADTNIVDVNDHSALDVAVLRSKRQLQEYLESKTSRQHSSSCPIMEPEIIEAVKQGNVQRVRAILDQDVNQCNACTPQDGATPLMFAAMLGNVDIVNMLIESNCDINRQDAVSGWTALMQATFHGKKSIVTRLISAGADVTVMAKNGFTAFDMAAVIEDVDAELYRILAALTLPTNRIEVSSNKSTKLSAPKPDLVLTTEMTDSSVSTVTSSTGSTNDEVQQQKTGIKAWWSRISNRFHNLKPERLPSSTKHRDSVNSYDKTLTSDGIDSMLSSARNSVQDTAALVNHRAISVAHDNKSCFETVAVPPNKSTLMFPLGTANLLRQGSSGSLKPVVPPFFPPPTFQSDRNTKMPPIGLRKPISCSANTQTPMSHSINANAKLLQSTMTPHLTLNLVNRVASPPPRVQFVAPTTSRQKSNVMKLSSRLADVSPSASCNTATLSSSGGTVSSSSSTQSPRSKVISSASSSTLTAGSDNNGKSDGVAKKRKERDAKKHAATDEERRTSSRATAKHSFEYPSHVASSCASSKDSSSTLTPIPSLRQHAASTNLTGSMTSNHSQDDLENILQKLSLERYQPIFEEQEVDMEAFLTLTEADLLELGISNADSRQQILSAIGELNSSKDRERQHYQKVLESYSGARSEDRFQQHDNQKYPGGHVGDLNGVINVDVSNG